MKINNFLDLLNGKELKNTEMSYWFRKQIKYNDTYIDTDNIFTGFRAYDGGLVIGYLYGPSTIVDISCIAQWHVLGIRDVTKEDLYRINEVWKSVSEKGSFEPIKKTNLDIYKKELNSL